MILADETNMKQNYSKKFFWCFSFITDINIYENLDITRWPLSLSFSQKFTYKTLDLSKKNQAGRNIIASLILPVPIPDEEKKLTQIFYFHTLWWLKRFYEAFIKPF